MVATISAFDSPEGDNFSFDTSGKEGLSRHGQMGYFGSLFYKDKNVRESSSWEKYTMKVDDLP